MRKKEVVLLSETEALERLLYRLPTNHSQRKFLEVEFYRKAAGKRGEERLDRKFIEFDLEEDYSFLRNLNLSLGEWKVQIDGLLLTNQGAVIIESKNISGQIHFEAKTGEFSRVDLEGNRTVMEDPTVQLNRHIRFLTTFFKRHKIDLPVNGLVVFTSKQCEFLTKPKSNYVCKTYQMIDYLFAIIQTFPPKVLHQNLLDIDRLLQQHQTPYKRIPLCQQYFIDSNDLVTGILCATCKMHTMRRKHKFGWICSNCNFIDERALYTAIQEYFSVIDHQLNNKRLRKFCNLDSPYTTSRILAEFDFAVSGALKNRIYELKRKD